jgi:prevent-host-death family protein
MADEYSLSEAKAKLSALVRQVREGRTIVITVHGQPAAELQPVDPSARRQTLEERLADLDARGAVVRAKRAPAGARAFPIGPRLRGALQRFLKERD